MFADCFQLWSESADTRWPFHGEVIADVAAHQWWIGANPEALRKENMELFDINKVPLSSNMIALVCSAVSDPDYILCPLLLTAHARSSWPWMRLRRGSRLSTSTRRLTPRCRCLLILCSAKLTFRHRHDEFKATIDELRASADPNNKELYDEGCAKFCKSMNDTLANHIRYR